MPHMLHHSPSSIPLRVIFDEEDFRQAEVADAVTAMLSVAIGKRCLQHQYRFEGVSFRENITAQGSRQIMMCISLTSDEDPDFCLMHTVLLAPNTQGIFEQHLHMAGLHVISEFLDKLDTTARRQRRTKKNIYKIFSPQ